jgi:hypothetical protein
MLYGPEPDALSKRRHRSRLAIRQLSVFTGAEPAMRVLGGGLAEIPRRHEAPGPEAAARLARIGLVLLEASGVEAALIQFGSVDAIEAEFDIADGERVGVIGARGTMSREKKHRQ